MNRIRVLIAEDHPLTTAGLKIVIDGQPGWELVGELTDGSGLISMLDEVAVDVLLLDLGLPGRTGLDLLLETQNRTSRPKVIILSGQPDSGAFQRALDAGADGVLTKGDPPEEIVKAVEAVLANERFIAPSLAERLVLSPVVPDQLTSRERDVLRCMHAGMSSKETARELSIAPATAKKHRENLMRKLGASSAINALREAQRRGLVSG